MYLGQYENGNGNGDVGPLAEAFPRAERYAVRSTVRTVRPSLADPLVREAVVNQLARDTGSVAAPAPTRASDPRIAAGAPRRQGTARPSAPVADDPGLLDIAAGGGGGFFDSLALPGGVMPWLLGAGALLLGAELFLSRGR